MQRTAAEQYQSVTEDWVHGKGNGWKISLNPTSKNGENNLPTSLSGLVFPTDSTAGGHAEVCRCPAELNLEATDDATL